MAIITIIATGYMCGVLTLRRRAIVAGEAGTKYLGVIDRPRRIPCCRAMAVLADIRRADMTLVLAGNIDAVMTGKAVTGNAGMVENSRDPK